MSSATQMPDYWALEFLQLNDVAIDLRDRLEKVAEENAKLRELVRDMCEAFVHGACYRWCEFKEPCNYMDDGKCQWCDRMRELGVDA